MVSLNKDCLRWKLNKELNKTVPSVRGKQKDYLMVFGDVINVQKNLQEAHTTYRFTL